MPTESEKRIAALAVSRYGADRARVRTTYLAVAEARAQGRPADLLEMLVAGNVLTATQEEEIRLDLNGTPLDPALGGWQLAPGQNEDDTPPSRPVSGNGRKDPAPTASGYILRSLGEFQLLRRLGQGGMGSVYLAFQKSQERQVAIKVMSDQLAGNQAYVERFHREAKSGTRLNHANLVRCIAAGKDEASGKHYLVMEYVDGVSGRTLIDRHGRVPVGDAVHIVLDIAKALEHIHARNYVHRDIKPDNILITRSGVSKLADLGLAKFLGDSTHLTALRQGFGTIYYMPYEQAVNAKEVDGRSDIYALGATLYHLVTGEVPFSGNNHLEIAEKKLVGKFPSASILNPDVTDELNLILEKMLAAKPADRYQTASELIVDLERSKLAAEVPSFIDKEQALQDPVVLAKLSAPAPATQLDLAAPDLTNSTPGTSAFWYLRYRDSLGKWCKTRGTKEQLAQRIRGGWRPEGLQACPPGQEDFRPIEQLTEFQEALSAASPHRSPQPAEEDADFETDSEVAAEATAHAGPSRLALVLFAVISSAFAVVIGAVIYRLVTR